jgi:hypothetical protein
MGGRDRINAGVDRRPPSAHRRAGCDARDVPTSYPGILTMIAHARSEGFLDDPVAATVTGMIERAVAGMLGSR